MSGARIDASGRIERLDGRAEPTKSIEEADVKSPSALVRILRDLLADVGGLKRRTAPRRLTFPATTVAGDGTTKYRFQHDFGVIPDLFVVRWDGAAAPNFAVHADSTTSTLVLVSLSAGVATIRLEAS